MTYNKHQMMKAAWIMYKDTNTQPWLIPMTFGECLESVWADRQMFAVA